MFDVDGVKERLRALGYEGDGEGDTASLSFCVDKVKNSIRNKIHRECIPPNLEHAAVDMAAGEFLLMKKTFASESLAGLDLGAAVKQIQTGDTNTVFVTGEGSLTAEQRLDGFISRLLARESEIMHYRRLKW